MYYYLSVFVHILSAVFWIGGMLFTVAILVPASRHELFEKRKGTFFAIIGRKFSRASWLLFGLLFITGITNLLSRGYEMNDLVSASFWNGTFGTTLLIKLHLFGLVLVVSGLHDFYAGPKAAKLMDAEPGAPRTGRFRKFSRWLGRINLLLGLGILYYAMKLLRG
ncbi:MAG: DUF4149 domain-containing protein [Balneolaceae bacterium]|nr:DUF4149 domain-containing protein [Balneolaceae bacterium]